MQYAKMIGKASNCQVAVKTEDLEFKIQNIVGSHDVGF